MTETAPAYNIISRVHINRWNEELQRAVPGWDIKARWNATGTIIPVFVPDAAYTPDNIDRLIRAAGATDDAIHNLGA